MDPTAADASMEELFGPVLGKRPTPATLPPKEEATERPAKAGKPNAGGKGRGAGSQGQGSRGRNQRSQGSGASGQQQQGSQKGQISKDTLKLVTRILMHQQESISTLRLSTGWVWWLRIPEPSPIAMMIQAAQVWREEVVKPDSPHRETPIRQAIFWSLIQAPEANALFEKLSQLQGSAALQAYRFLRSLPPSPHFLPGMLLWACSSGVFNGDWMARRHLDGGPDRLRAQFLIHEWHSQAAVHALRQPPRILILRFARYTDGPSGAAKNHALVTWTRVLQMPMFTGDGTESANCAYSVEAAILHSGLSITTGLMLMQWSTPLRLFDSLQNLFNFNSYVPFTREVAEPWYAHKMRVAISATGDALADLVPVALKPAKLQPRQWCVRFSCVFFNVLSGVVNGYDVCITTGILDSVDRDLQLCDTGGAVGTCFLKEPGGTNTEGHGKACTGFSGFFGW
eukprot:s3189_g11.t1